MDTLITYENLARFKNGLTMDSLSDIGMIGTPSDGQTLAYNSAENKWVNADSPTGVLTVTLSRTTSQYGSWVWTCDKTWDEIYTASSSGKIVCVWFNQYTAQSPTDYVLYQAVSIHEHSGIFALAYFPKTDAEDYFVKKNIIYDDSNSQPWSFHSSQYCYSTDKPVRIYRYLTGTAAVTASPYTHAKWDVSDSTVSAYVDGMVVCLKVPVAGNGTYGTGFQINNLGYKPVVYNISSMVSTRYGVGSVVWAVYNSTQTASLYINSDAATTVTGCWQVNDYGTSDTNSIGYQLRTNSSVRPTVSRTRYYRILFSSADNTQWVPANTGYDNSATSKKTVKTTPINPFGRIVYMSGTTNVTAGSNVGATATWDQYGLTLGYSFNTTGAALVLTYPAPVYIKCAPQSDGSAIIDADTPYVQALPSTADGKIYIYLGQTYSATQVEMTYDHPIYYHDGDGIRIWTGATSGSNVQRGLNQSDSVTRNAPSGTDFTHTENTAVNGGAVEVVFESGKKCTRYISSSGSIDVSLAINNFAENRLWIANTGDSSINVDFSLITNSTIGTIFNCHMPETPLSIPVGKEAEIDAIVNSDGAFITYRNDLAKVSYVQATVNAVSSDNSLGTVSLNGGPDFVFRYGTTKSVTMTATPSSGSVFFVKWQSSPDGTTWTDVTGGTNTTFTATLSDSGTYYYKAIFQADSR